MKTLTQIQQFFREIKPIIQQKFKVSEIGIFGSYVRGEQTENSDIDVLVDFIETPTLFDLVELEDYLSEELGVKIDLVHKPGLKEQIKPIILKEVVYI